MMKYFLAIAGNVGVGKSTLTRLLAARLGWQPFMEAVDDNPYLADFYQDMPRWGFHSQIYFLSRRLRHHRALVDHPGSVVQDRSVYEDAEIFARNLYARGALGERDYHSYRELYEAIASFLPPPDLVIYLRAPTATLLRRIEQRGRTFEREISPAYVAQLNDLYEEWAATFKLAPVLPVDAGSLDYVNNVEHFEQVVGAVCGRLALAVPP